MHACQIYKSGSDAVAVEDVHVCKIKASCESDEGNLLIRHHCNYSLPNDWFHSLRPRELSKETTKQHGFTLVDIMLF